MAKKAKRKPQNIKSFLIPRLRQISRYWGPKNEVLNSAKIVVDDGFYQNGNKKTKVKFKCAKCGELFNRDEVNVDHIHPIANIEGFTTWDSYIERMFCQADGLQILCEICHKEKSRKELDERLSKKD